ncbi:putative neuronal acetylcholine receptor subunit beta-3 isoform X2 [Apostichopus japonicus]|uniref:Putative neuronal acetylcholine receptor subunit beta-3 isoform X2 n=1 Tax=Stichopus japonicus TaxID=307972 RepID=A0A2G8KHR5_STIJA|nr:putative neuronal acetylcholine receptor subunit beta-3 isoform X2 [Apostichopus japonicus]
MMKLTWEDYRLSWQPDEYDGILETRLPLTSQGDELIWRPELVLNESVSSDFASFIPETTAVVVKHTGKIYWYTLANMQSFCSVSVRNYPFDKPNFHLTFTTWLYQTTQRILVRTYSVFSFLPLNSKSFIAVTDLIDGNAYKQYDIKHGLWELDIATVDANVASYDCDSCENQTQSYVHYVLELRRGERFSHFLAIILPCLIMSGLTTVVICLSDKEETHTSEIGLTCVLTLFVSLTFVFTKLPSTGQPIIGSYIIWLIIEAVMVTVYGLINALNLRKKRPRMPWLRKTKYSIVGVKIVSSIIYAIIFAVMFSK